MWIYENVSKFDKCPLPVACVRAGWELNPGQQIIIMFAAKPTAVKKIHYVNLIVIFTIHTQIIICECVETKYHLLNDDGNLREKTCMPEIP